MLHDVKIAITTDVNGDSADKPAYWPGLCYLEKIILDFGDLAVNMDFVMTTAGHGVTETFFTKANQAAADAIWYPRLLANDAADASAIAATDGNAYWRILLDGIPTVTTAQGGNAKSGVIWLVVDVPAR